MKSTKDRLSEKYLYWESNNPGKIETFELYFLEALYSEDTSDQAEEIRQYLQGASIGSSIKVDLEDDDGNPYYLCIMRII